MDPSVPPTSDPEAREREEIWRGILMGTDDRFRRGRRIFHRLPASPRCKMCASPFAGPFGFALRRFGKGPWPKNPKYCGQCFTILETRGGGAEIPLSILFADVRGSTALAERMSPSAFRDLLSRFYAVTTQVLVDRDAIVDKYVGDEVMALFIPALSSDAHAARAIDAAGAILAATGNSGTDTPWIPVGVGIATGTAYVGAVGAGDAMEMTALGDIVNVGARLATAAAAGEILVMAEGARQAGVDETLERRSLDLKGKRDRVDVVVLGAAAHTAAATPG